MLGDPTRRWPHSWVALRGKTERKVVRDVQASVAGFWLSHHAWSRCHQKRPEIFKVIVVALKIDKNAKAVKERVAETVKRRKRKQ